MKVLNQFKTIDLIKVMHLILQTYDEKNKDRLDEIEYCMLSNLDNPNITMLHNLYEDSDTYLDESIRTHKKYKGIKSDSWLTYKKAFEYCNKNLSGQLCAITNNDIMLDEKKWDMKLEEKIVYALSRHEFNIVTETGSLDVNFNQLFHAHTQDMWIFNSPIEVKDCNFEIGILGCDNAIADRFRKSGYRLLNRPETFKIFHLDTVRGKTSNNFLNKHNEQKNVQKFPEKEGYYLLPNFDRVSQLSFDEILKMFNFSDIDRYELICNVITSRVKIENKTT